MAAGTAVMIFDCRGLVGGGNGRARLDPVHLGTHSLGERLDIERYPSCIVSL